MPKVVNRSVSEISGVEEGQAGGILDSEGRSGEGGGRLLLSTVLTFSPTEALFKMPRTELFCEDGKRKGG